MKSLKKLWPRVRLFLKFQYCKRMRKYSPLVASLFLTSRCNLNCEYCFAEHRGEFKDLSVSQWKDIVDELKRRGTELVFLMGGEPLLYEGVGEIIEYVKRKGIQCHLTTNGILIPKFIDELKQVDLVMTSLDGNKAGNDLNRGEGSFEKITRGIEVAKQNNISLRINCVLTRNNVDDVEWLLDYAEKINAYVGFSIPAKCPETESMGSMVLSDEEVIEAHEKLLQLSREGRKITLSERSIRHVLSYPKHFDELVYKDERNYKNVSANECCYGRYCIFIDAEGSVYPCTTLWERPEVYKPKNVFRDDWNEALRNAQRLPCWICYRASGVEWENMTSFRGIIHALEFSLAQAR